MWMIHSFKDISSECSIAASERAGWREELEDWKGWNMDMDRRGEEAEDGETGAWHDLKGLGVLGSGNH